MHALRNLIVALLALVMTAACQEQKQHTAPPIYERDSVAMMTTLGVNTLISDSGVIKYRIVTEQWDVNQNVNPHRWIFVKGIFLEQFDEKFHVEAYVQADTAYYYFTERLWELRSRVRVLTSGGLRFSSEQLFHDERSKEFYSNVYSQLVTPERTLRGTRFRSNEDMTRYNVSNSQGSFERTDITGEQDGGAGSDSTQNIPMRPQAQPRPSR